MTKFVLVTDGSQFRAINIDQAREIRRDKSGKVTIYFDRTHIVLLEGESGKQVIDVITRQGS